MSDSSKDKDLEKLIKEWQDQTADYLQNPEAVTKTMEIFYKIQKSYFDVLNNNENKSTETEPKTNTKYSTNTNDSVDAYERVSCDECAKRINELESRISRLERLFKQSNQATG